MKPYRRTFWTFLFTFISHILVILPVYAIEGAHPIVIISSYNPDSRQTSINISDFMEEFRSLGGDIPISMENMNCQSFSESPLWKGRMRQLLSKYQGENSPSLLVLIGQEAWASYLSQEKLITGDTPVLVALASRNAIILPKDSNNLKKLMPKSIDLFEDFPHSHVHAGFVYEYNVKANINLIKRLYPFTRNIAFISDNTYGGVSLQAHVLKEMKKFPELRLILLDGRTNTIYSISDKLHSLPPNTAILLGTWRVDMREGYFMRNATYTMMDAAPHIPAFSISSIGIGYWAIGGYVPAYRPLGADMARQAIHILANKNNIKHNVEIIPNKLVMDSEKIKKLNLNLSSIHESVEWVNESPSFYSQYKYWIWGFGAFLCFLSGGFFISLYFYVRTKRLKDELVVSGRELREAKDNAEESSRLKSAFLANMSHEIRTPLNAIVGFSDVLVSGDYNEKEGLSYANIIRTNSNLLLRLIDDILDLSRLEANRIAFTPERCNIVPICEGMIYSSNQIYASSENHFVFECKEKNVEMIVDVQRFQQVLSNLLSNADKFTQEGVITLKLELDVVHKMAVFSLTDTGCGIPMDKRKKVFERFSKLNEYIQGTGLGLAICKVIVEKWGGKIWIDPDYCEGSRFIFTHPLEL